MRADRPTSLKELREILHQSPRNLRFIAGGTDLVLHLRRSPNEDFHLVDLSSLEELRQITLRENTLLIGAGVTFDELERSPLVQEHARGLAKAASQVGSPQIRNRGTLGGNFMNRSAAADGVPPLLALEAQALGEDETGAEHLFSLEDLDASGHPALQNPLFLLKGFQLPLTKERYSDFAKVGSRTGVTISKLSLALSCSFEEGRICHPRLFGGSLATYPQRCKEAEALLASENPGYEAFLQSLRNFVQQTIPSRGSMPYKRRAIQGLGDDLWKRLQEVHA
jgi:carbon-monoxide dehydrogenase medium subunit